MLCVTFYEGKVLVQTSPTLVKNNFKVQLVIGATIWSIYFAHLSSFRHLPLIIAEIVLVVLVGNFIQG